MKEIDDKHIEFVIKHYKPNSLNTQKALDKFQIDRGIYRSKHNPFLRWSGIATSIAIIAFILIRIIFTTSNEWVNLSADNQILTAYLPDSTKVVLAPGATLSYDAACYSKDGRHVNMSGDVFFKVVRNEQSPFKVFAKRAKIEVLGTQFLVEEHNDTTSLFVESGIVRFSSMDESSSEILTKGAAAEHINGKNRVMVVNPSNINPTAWATGKFIYDNTPIGEVLTELSRFYNQKLTTTDYSKNLTATFSSDSLNEIVGVIETVLDINVIYND